MAALAAAAPAAAADAGSANGAGDGAAAAAAAAAVRPRLDPERLEQMLLVVGVNAAPEGEPAVVLRDAAGTLYAPAEAVAAWRLVGLSPAFTRDGKAWFALRGMKLDLDAAAQTLRIDVAPDRLEASRVRYAAADAGPMTRSATGAFLNYEIVGTLADDRPSLDGRVEAGIFTPRGVAVTSFVGHADSGGARAVRLESSFTMDDPAHMRSLRFGDSVTRGGVGGTPLRFAGIQFGRNFAMQPGFIAFPTPSLRGSAAVASVIDVYVNNVLRDRRDLQPGPFEISNIPIVTGTGDVQLVVRDLLGRESLVSQSYYASPRLLRQGLSDYSLELGFLRRDYGYRSDAYGSFVASGTARYGISDALTAEVHVEAIDTVQMAGVGADVAVPGLGAVEASVAGSTSPRGRGFEAAAGFERRSRDVSFGVRAEVASKDYATPGLLQDRKPPSLVVQAFAGMPVAFGSVGLSYLLREGRTEPDVELLSATASIRLARYATVYVGARRNLRGARDTAGELTLILPLGPRTSASAGVQIQDGSASLQALIQRALPVGSGWGYRAEALIGATDRFDGRLSYQTDFGTFDGEVSVADSRFGARFTAAGGFGLVGGQAFASRSLSQSFATVKVGDYPNVRVYADNQLVGTTNAAGVAVVPRLRPFDRTIIRLEVSDLPIDAEVTSAELAVRPPNRSGVRLDFKVRAARAALARLVREDGTPVPAGAAVRLAGHDDDFVSAPGGEVYLTGLGPDNEGIAAWDGGRCRFRLAAPRSREAQPRVGDLRCAALP